MPLCRLDDLRERVIDRVNVNLREPAFDVGPYVRQAVATEKFVRFYAFYGLTSHHPLHFRFSHSSLAGSYFLGRCFVDHALIYKSDVRGDELKRKGQPFRHGDISIPLHEDETIHVKDSFLIKTLVHNFSHDPENPEEFKIQNVVSMHYANIHGSPLEGCFLAPLSTVDLTTLHNCILGAYTYVQAGELAHRAFEPGEVWIKADGAYEFHYVFSPEVLARYIRLDAKNPPQGVLMDSVECREEDFQEIFERIHTSPVRAPEGAFVSRYAVVKGDTHIDQNVLVAQRSYLEDAWLGKGTNAQENCYIIGSRLEGNNVTAHGGKVLHCCLEPKVFVGFNAFLNGKPECPMEIGHGSIVMPHTIIDPKEPISIPPESLVWGFIRTPADLETHSVSFEDMLRSEGELTLGSMRFRGNGARFIKAFRERVEHILQANGAYFDGVHHRGHAQQSQDMVFNTIQPYPEGVLKGLYPTMDIRPIPV